MYKELELWNAVEIIYEIIALNNAPLATKCGGDFKEGVRQGEEKSSKLMDLEIDDDRI